MAGAVGGLGISYLAGAVLNFYKNAGDVETGYVILFIVAGCAYLIAWTIMALMTPKNKKVIID